MKSFLLITIFLAPIFLFGQTISYDTSKTFKNQLNWTGIHYKNPDEKKSYDVWTFYYENGQKRLEEITDTNFTYHKKVNSWLANGTQLLKNGNGFYIELNGKDSLVYTVKDSVFNGTCKTFIRFPNNKSWKIHCTGNYSNNVRIGEWLFFDSTGTPTASCSYENDQVKGKCSIYFPKIGIISQTGNIEDCQKVGVWKFFDSTGILLVECNYENGEKKGEYTSYYSNGKIKSQGQYIHETQKFKIPIEDPKHPGNFNYIYKTIRLTNVPAKNGWWYFYNENGELIKSKKYHHQKEVPEYLEPISWVKHHFYLRTAIPFQAIPECNYY